MKKKLHAKHSGYVSLFTVLLLVLIMSAGCAHQSSDELSGEDFSDAVSPGQTVTEEKAEEVAKKDRVGPAHIAHAPLDSADFVGKAKIGSAGGEGIHSSKWTPRKKAPWICVVRAKDPEKRLEIAYAMKQALKLTQVRYSIDKKKRVTFYEEAEKLDFDLPLVTADCYTTCSSVASVCLRAAGYSEKTAPKLVYSDSNSSKTNLRKHLKKSDFFTYFETPDYTASADLLQPGDLLFSEHHTAVVIRSKNMVELDQ